MRFLPRRRSGGAAKVGEPTRPSGHLFIIGAARTGTTVLQNALNDSRDVFLMGEPDIYADEGPGFRARYNAMHRSWGNQATKSTYLPAFGTGDGGWRDHLAAAAARHRWVGAKLVINPVHAADDIQRRFDLHTREFYDARYIFTFRAPMEAAVSTHDLQLLTRGESDGLAKILTTYLEIVGFYIQAIRLLPHVTAVFHEDVDTEVFADLSRWLDADLSRGASYYDATRIRPSREDGETSIPENIRTALADFYADLRAEARCGHDRPQLEQNDRHLSPTHYLPLGSLDRRARVIAGALAGESP